MVLWRLTLGATLVGLNAHAAPDPRTITLTPVPIPHPDYTGSDPPSIAPPVRTWLPPELSSLIPTPSRGGGNGGGEQPQPAPSPAPEPDPEDGPDGGAAVPGEDPQDPGDEAEEELGCHSTGIDYVNGGTYNIDVTSDEFFFFTSEFKGMLFPHGCLTGSS